MVQNCKGEFIKKINNYQMTLINTKNNNKYHDHIITSMHAHPRCLQWKGHPLTIQKYALALQKI